MTDFSLAAAPWAPGNGEDEPAGPSHASVPAPSADLLLFLESTTDSVMLVDRDWRLTYVNRHAADNLGRPAEALRGQRLWDAVPSLIGSRFETDYRAAMETRQPAAFQDRRGASGRWYDVQISPLPSSGLGIWFRDITPQKLAERKCRAVEERLHLAATASDDLIWDLDLASGQIEWSAAIGERFGYDLVGSTSDLDWWEARIHPDDHGRCVAIFRASLESAAGRFVCEYRFRRADGSYADVLDRGFLVRDETGTPARMVGAIQDNSERNAAMAELRIRESQLATVFGQAMVGIVHSTLDGRVMMANARFCQMLGRSEAGVVGASYVEYTHPDDLEWNRRLFEQHLGSGKPFQIEKRYVRSDGGVIWCAVHVSFVLDEQGDSRSCITVVEDITGARETAERLRRASEEDSLTGLANRRSFQAHLQAATLRAMHSGREVGLLLLDLDHFKHVNDTLGHAGGDHVLRTFADRLRQTARPRDLVARLGGDEFAIMIEDISGPQDLLALGDRIVERLRKPTVFEGRPVDCSATIGGALFPGDAGNAHELFKNADTALYALKAAGRGGTKMFHSHMREQAQQISSQLSLARFAIAERSVLPFYQPKLCLADGRLEGFEALLRWRHDGRGIQGPDSVAEAFKDYQLASSLGALMQAAVIEDIQSLRAAGIDFGRISINAAPAEFLRDDYAERLLALLAARDVPPALIEVEVTEHVFLDRGSDYVGRALGELTRAGIRIALDDFGTGYSSLSHLRDFPVDVVKIDRSFVERMLCDPEIAAIVIAVINLARSLSIDVVAEGIEEEAQRRFLAEHGCGIGQGFLFGAAAEAAAIPAMVRRG